MGYKRHSTTFHHATQLFIKIAHTNPILKNARYINKNFEKQELVAHFLDFHPFLTNSSSC